MTFIGLHNIILVYQKTCPLGRNYGFRTVLNILLKKIVQINFCYIIEVRITLLQNTFSCGPKLTDGE